MTSKATWNILSSPIDCSTCEHIIYENGSEYCDHYYNSNGIIEDGARIWLDTRTKCNNWILRNEHK